MFINFPDYWAACSATSAEDVRVTDLAGPSGAAIIAAFKAAKVEFIAALPDIWTSKGLLWPLSRDSDLRLVRLSKEDEGVSICSGLAYAGRRSVLLMQYTGFLDSVNAIRGAAVEYHRPVCMVVGLLGKEADREAAASAVYGIKLTVDVVAATGVASIVIEEPGDVARLAPAIERAYATSRPLVALVGRRVEA
jgi:sulfopyruvate decarboxylase TPP-binding subunit